MDMDAIEVCEDSEYDIWFNKLNDVQKDKVQEIITLLQDGKGTRPRRYQLEMYLSVIDPRTGVANKNMIIFLPTGAGKTLVSVMVMRKVMLQEPSKKIIFVADTVTLCHQQSMVFVTETKKPCAQLYGDQTDTARKMHKRSKVWFATPQIVVNMLQSGELNLEDVSMIVFDEAHHCTKNSPYNVIMRDYYFLLPKARRPLVFGMTASPGARKGFSETLKTIGQLCLNMESDIVMPKDNYYELSQYVNQPNEYLYPCPFTAAELAFIDIIETYLKNIVKIIPKQLQVQDPETCLAKGYNQAVHAMSQRIDEERRMDLKPLIEHMSKCYEAYEQLSDLGWQVGVAGLKESIENLTNSWNPGQDVLDAWRSAKQVLNDQIQQFVERKLAEDDDPRNNCPKIKQLIEVLSAYKAHEHDEDLRIIIFIRMRSTAKQLLELLSDVESLSFLRKGLLIGHGDSSSERGMKTTKQVQVAKDFREGAINCLVATSVAEEGFDIAACNVVIRFDAMDNVTAFVQSRGRARKSQSDFIVIYRDKDGEFNLKQIKEQEQHMVHSVVAIMKGEISFQSHLAALRQADARQFVEEDCPKILHEWCQKKFGGSAHDVELIPHKSRNPKAPVRWSANIHFPKPIVPNESQLPTIYGGLRKTDTLAKRAAAYDACIFLHNEGLLAQHIGNDFLLIKQKVTEDGEQREIIISDKPNAVPIVGGDRSGDEVLATLPVKRDDPADRRVVFRNFPTGISEATVRNLLSDWLNKRLPMDTTVDRIQRIEMHDMIDSRNQNGPVKAKAADVLFTFLDDSDVIVDEFYEEVVGGNSIKPEPYIASELNPQYIEEQHKQMQEFDKKFEFHDTDGYIIRPNVSYAQDSKSRQRRRGPPANNAAAAPVLSSSMSTSAPIVMPGGLYDGRALVQASPPKASAAPTAAAARPSAAAAAPASARLSAVPATTTAVDTTRPASGGYGTDGKSRAPRASTSASQSSPPKPQPEVTKPAFGASKPSDLDKKAVEEAAQLKTTLLASISSPPHKPAASSGSAGPTSVWRPSASASTPLAQAAHRSVQAAQRANASVASKSTEVLHIESDSESNYSKGPVAKSIASNSTTTEPKSRRARIEESKGAMDDIFLNMPTVEYSYSIQAKVPPPVEIKPEPGRTSVNGFPPKKSPVSGADIKKEKDFFDDYKRKSTAFSRDSSFDRSKKHASPSPKRSRAKSPSPYRSDGEIDDSSHGKHDKKSSRKRSRSRSRSPSRSKSSVASRHRSRSRNRERSPKSHDRKRSTSRGRKETVEKDSRHEKPRHRSRSKESRHGRSRSRSKDRSHRKTRSPTPEQKYVKKSPKKVKRLEIDSESEEQRGRKRHRRSRSPPSPPSDESDKKLEDINLRDVTTLINYLKKAKDSKKRTHDDDSEDNLESKHRKVKRSKVASRSRSSSRSSSVESRKSKVRSSDKNKKSSKRDRSRSRETKVSVKVKDDPFQARTSREHSRERSYRDKKRESSLERKGHSSYSSSHRRSRERK